MEETRGGTQKRGTWTGSGEDRERKGIDPSTLSTCMKLPKKPFEMSFKKQVFLIISCYFY